MRWSRTLTGELTCFTVMFFMVWEMEAPGGNSHKHREYMQTPHRKKGHQACDQQSCQSKSVIMADQLTTVTFVS